MDPRVEKLLKMANAGKVPPAAAAPTPVENSRPLSMEEIINESAELVNFIESGAGSSSDAPKVEGRDIVREKLTEGAMIALEACGKRPTKFVEEEKGQRETLNLTEYLLKRVR